MPIDEEFNGKLMYFDETTNEYKELAPLEEVPSLEADPIPYCYDSLNRLKGSITMAGKAAAKSMILFAQLRKVVLEWLFSDALQSGDKRKIKRAKRKYKAMKRELRRRIQNDS